VAGKKKADASTLSEDELFEAMCKASKSRSAKEILEYQKTLPCYSTGCIPLDQAFGCTDPETGLPGVRGRDKVEALGPYKSLKTAVMENVVINALNRKPDNRVVLILPEEGDMGRLESRGADMDRVQVLAFYDPDVEQHWRNAETVLAQAVQFSRLKNVVFVGVDSVAQLTLQIDIEDKDGEQRDYAKSSKVGAHATLMQTFLKDWNLNNRNSVLWLNNQIRDFIPTNKFNMFEDAMRQRTPGGNAMRHGMDWRLSFFSKKHEAEADHPTLKKRLGEGLDFHFRFLKEKYPRKFNDKTGQNTFWFDPPGFDAAEGILPFAIHFGLIEKSGPAHFIVNDHKLHGQAALIHYLESNPEYVEHLIKEVSVLNRDESFYGGEPRPSAKLR
jgi:RecA/RadA recombinase